MNIPLFFMKIVRIYNCCLNLCKDRNKIAIKQNIYEDIVMFINMYYNTLYLDSNS